MSASKKKADPVSAPRHFKDCPHWGKGGSFTYDPVTKQRTRVTGAGITPTPQVDGTAPAPAPAKDKKEAANG